MPILDYGDEFAKSQAITATAFGAHWEQSANAKDWATGALKTPYARVTNDNDFDALTSLKIDVGVADDTNGTNFTVLSTITVLLAALLKNKVFAMPALTPGTKKKCLGCKLTVTGANPTVGKIIVGLIAPSGRPQNAVNTL